MKQLFVFLSCLFLLNHVLSAQYMNTSTASAESIKNRILLVGLAEEAPAFLKQYQDHPENLKAYKEAIEGKNYVLKKAVDSFWTFSTSVKFLPMKDAKKLMKTEKDKYAFMHYEEDWNSHYLDLPKDDSIKRRPAFAWSKKDGKLVYNTNTRYMLENIVISSLIIELPKKATEVFLPTLHPSEGDLIYAIQSMQYILRYVLEPNQNSQQLFRDTKARAATLKEKILLLDNKQINRSLTKEEIKKSYPYPCQTATHEKIEQVLKAKDPNYVVVTIARYDPNYSIHTIVDAADGTLYFLSSSLTFEYGTRIGSLFLVEMNPFGITPTHMQEYAQNIK